MQAGSDISLHCWAELFLQQLPFVQRKETSLSEAGISHDAILNCEWAAGQIWGFSPKISWAAREACVTVCFLHVGGFTVEFLERAAHYVTFCLRAAINLQLTNFMRPVKPWHWDAS